MSDDEAEALIAQGKAIKLDSLEDVEAFLKSLEGALGMSMDEAFWRAQNIVWGLGMDGLPLPSWVRDPGLVAEYDRGCVERQELGHGLH